MKTAKLTNKYDYENRSFTRNSYRDNEYGFEGTYTNQDLGECTVVVTQCGKVNYYLMLDIWKGGKEYHRNFDCSHLPTHRLAGLKAKEFLEDIRVKLIEEELEKLSKFNKELNSEMGKVMNLKV